MNEKDAHKAMPADDPFANTQWDTHRRAQLQRWAKISFPQKLEFLEEAHRMILEFKLLNEKRNG